MKTCIVAICLISVCFAQDVTTHYPHRTHEPNEGEGITFAYSGYTHDLIVRQQYFKTRNCYIADLTPAEEKQIHTDSGMRNAELRVLTQLSTATMADPSSIDAQNVKMCGHAPVNGTLKYFVL